MSRVGDAHHVACVAVSTYDDRSEKQADEGLFYQSKPAGSTYNAAGHDPAADQFDEFATESGGGNTSIMAPASSLSTDTADPFAGPVREPYRWHGGADFGLLVLRLVVGGTFVANGLQELFGLFHGMGRTGLGQLLAFAGYQHVSVLVWVTGGTELVAGALIVLGLFTPIAAAGMLGLLANLIVLKWPNGFFGSGYQLELVLSAAAFALLFAGPGRVSLDRPTPWFRRPVLNGFLFLIIAAAAALVALLVLRHHR
jgi:putative oxidoreductase